jgi:hypothetical protein
MSAKRNCNTLGHLHRARAMNKTDAYQTASQWECNDKPSFASSAVRLCSSSRLSPLAPRP